MKKIQRVASGILSIFLVVPSYSGYSLTVSETMERRAKILEQVKELWDTDQISKNYEYITQKGYSKTKIKYVGNRFEINPFEGNFYDQKRGSDWRCCSIGSFDYYNSEDYKNHPIYKLVQNWEMFSWICGQEPESFRKNLETLENCCNSGDLDFVKEEYNRRFQKFIAYKEYSNSDSLKYLEEILFYNENDCSLVQWNGILNFITLLDFIGAPKGTYQDLLNFIFENIKRHWLATWSSENYYTYVKKGVCDAINVGYTDNKFSYNLECQKVMEVLGKKLYGKEKIFSDFEKYLSSMSLCGTAVRTYRQKCHEIDVNYNFLNMIANAWNLKLDRSWGAQLKEILKDKYPKQRTYSENTSNNNHTKARFVSNFNVRNEVVSSENDNDLQTKLFNRTDISSEVHNESLDTPDALLPKLNCKSEKNIEHSHNKSKKIVTTATGVHGNLDVSAETENENTTVVGQTTENNTNIEKENGTIFKYLSSFLSAPAIAEFIKKLVDKYM